MALMKKLILYVGAVMTASAVTPCTAQTLAAGQGVADRSRPEYDPVGSRLGAYTVFPSITATAEVTDNYLATDTNRQSDAYLVLQPEVYLRSNFSRNRLDARAFVNQSLHARLPGDTATQFGASVSGAYEPTRTMQARADISAARYVESRASLGSFQGSREPVHYEAYHAGVGVAQGFNDLTLDGFAAIDYRDFHDTTLIAGGAFDQDYRDVRVGSVGGSAKYDLRNGIGLIVGGAYTDERYDVRPGTGGFLQGSSLNRDSSGFNFDGGVTLELSRLIFGSLRVGYLQRGYRDPRLSDFGGLSYSGNILWNVTTLTSLRFRASRTVEDTSSLEFAGNTRSDFGVSVDHELYRYVILSGDASYGHFTPNGNGIGGDEYSVGARARYLIDRRYSVSAGVRHSGRSSDSRFLRYQANYLNLALRVAY